MKLVKNIIMIICMFVTIIELDSTESKLISSVNILEISIDSLKDEHLENCIWLDFDSLRNNIRIINYAGSECKSVDYFEINSKSINKLIIRKHYDIVMKTIESQILGGYYPIIGLAEYFGCLDIKYFDIDCSNSTLNCIFNKNGQIEEYFYTENGIKKKRLFYYTYY